MRGSGPRISQATLKALERKRKAKLVKPTYYDIVFVECAFKQTKTIRHTLEKKCHNFFNIYIPLKKRLLHKLTCIIMYF